MTLLLCGLAGVAGSNVETETGLVFMSDTVLPVSLNNPDFLALASDAFLHATIAQGRRGTAMRGWSQAAGGSLSGAEKRALIAFLRTWSQEMYHPISRRADEAIRAGVVSFTKPPVPIAMAGRGDLGMGLAVTNPDFLAAVDDAFLWATIAYRVPESHSC